MLSSPLLGRHGGLRDHKGKWHDTLRPTCEGSLVIGVNASSRVANVSHRLLPLQRSFPTT